MFRQPCESATTVMRTNGALIRPDPHLLAAQPGIYGDNPATQTRRLAEALVCGPLWEKLRPRFGLTVRTEGHPVIGVLGTAGTGDLARLRALDWQVADNLARLRWVDFAEVEALCVHLAARLRGRFGSQLGRAWMVGIPRGGQVVVGLLSCALGMPATRVGAPPRQDADDLLLVVDDCALSGTRLRRWLQQNPQGRVAVVLLHASEGLRAAVEQEDRVVACVAASDLGDHAPAQQGANYANWIEWWRKRSPDDYWTGHPDHVVYPWNEPDTLLWNEETGRAEPAWRVVPPDRCLKNRSQMPSGSAGVQVCVAPDGSIGPADGVVWARAQGSIHVAKPTSARVTRMAGVAAACWSALMASGDEKSAAAAVATEYDEPLPRVRADLSRFIRECTTLGLLVERDT